MLLRAVCSTIVFLVVAGTRAAIAWDEPDAFRGVPWEASEAQIKAAVPGLACMPAPAGNTMVGDRSCFATFSIGDVSVKGYFFLRRDRFVRVYITFDPKQFSALAGAFEERYGAPTRQSEDEMKTRGGLSFTNVTKEWAGQKVMITLKKYAGKYSEGSAQLELLADREEAMKEFQDRKKRGARDL